MEIIQSIGLYVFWFLIVLTVVVFIHELGHFTVARLCGVRVEIFSIGFGRELFGHTSRSGTRWTFSLIPLGGYVKFFGDSGVASETNQALAQQMTEAERAVSFHHKALPQRSAVVAAGPVATRWAGEIGFLEIVRVVEQTLEQVPEQPLRDLDEVHAVDLEARRVATALIRQNPYTRRSN